MALALLSLCAIVFARVCACVCCLGVARAFWLLHPLVRRPVWSDDNIQAEEPSFDR